MFDQCLPFAICQPFAPPPGLDFNKIFVPTIDTTRYSYLATGLGKLATDHPGFGVKIGWFPMHLPLNRSMEHIWTSYLTIKSRFLSPHFPSFSMNAGAGEKRSSSSWAWVSLCSSSEKVELQNQWLGCIGKSGFVQKWRPLKSNSLLFLCFPH